MSVDSFKVDASSRLLQGPLHFNLGHNEGLKAKSSGDIPWPKMTLYDVQRFVPVFNQMDTDKDGKITGEQTHEFFLSWQLPRGELTRPFLNSFILQNFPTFKS